MSGSPEHSFSEHSQIQEFSEDSWKALAKIVRDVGPTLACDEELGDIFAAEAAVNIKDNERAVVLDQEINELNQLKRQLEQASVAAHRPSSHPTAAEHDAQVRSLEQQQYQTGKQLNEEQSLVSKKEIELSKLRNEKEEIGKTQVGENDDESGSADGNAWVNGKVIRLKMLNDTGFTLIPRKDGKSSNKLLIRNDLKDDVHSIPIDNNRSKVYTANLIWSLASEGC